jgi:hypothetical protein
MRSFAVRDSVIEASVIGEAGGQVGVGSQVRLGQIVKRIVIVRHGKSCGSASRTEPKAPRITSLSRPVRCPNRGPVLRCHRGSQRGQRLRDWLGSICLAGGSLRRVRGVNCRLHPRD